MALNNCLLPGVTLQAVINELRNQVHELQQEALELVPKAALELEKVKTDATVHIPYRRS